ncbi:8068_t:CDS:2 [Scutellospora calospora]|uniref:8068_t:CDS:1 n=1 Tax=Scutellospora calospora TaxID=85575 RepID=A0ACA9JUN5_9GLOM|nr:8068_t:CDS:2 [Scutellospora calospora]
MPRVNRHKHHTCQNNRLFETMKILQECIDFLNSEVRKQKWYSNQLTKELEILRRYLSDLTRRLSLTEYINGDLKEET